VTREATPATSHRLDLLVVQILPAVWADFNIETLILSDFDVQIISRNLTTVSHPLAESLNGFLLDRRFEAGAGCGCDSLVVFEETRELGDCILIIQRGSLEVGSLIIVPSLQIWKVGLNLINVQRI
jgi:hypothetical protein